MEIDLILAYYPIFSHKKFRSWQWAMDDIDIKWKKGVDDQKGDFGIKNTATEFNTEAATGGVL